MFIKEFLLKGCAVNQRVERKGNELHTEKKEIDEIKLLLNTSLSPDYGILCEGQVSEAFV